MMWKRIAIAALLCMMIAANASAELFTGVTSARGTTTLTCTSVALPPETLVEIGMQVSEGDTLARAVPQKVFATQDGTVSRVLHDAGDLASDDVLEIVPISRYVVYATVEDARSVADNRLVHCGETVYMKCKSNGTHLAVGRIYSIDGETYMVETTGGELYIGEVVYLYRNSDMESTALVGTGTVVGSDTEKYSSNGRIGEMYVAEGDYVERGQLLYTVLPSTDSEITAPVNGIVYSVSSSSEQADAGNGTAVAANVAQTPGMTASAAMPDSGASASTAADTAETESEYETTVTIVPMDQICVEISVSEEYVSAIAIGDRAEVNYMSNAEAEPVGGTVCEISHSAGDDTYSVLIEPDVSPEMIGLDAEVRLELNYPG